MGHQTLKQLYLTILILLFGLTQQENITTDQEIHLELMNDVEFKPWELVMDLEWSMNGDILAVSSGEYIRFYNPFENTLLNEVEIGSFTHSVDFSPDGKWFAAGSRDGIIRVWEVIDLTQTELEISKPFLQISAHKKGINSIKFDPNSHRIASSGDDRIAKIWNVPTGQNSGSLIGGSLVIPTISFADRGETMAIGNGNLIRVREVESERITGTFLSENPVFCMDLSADGQLLAAGDITNKIMVWNQTSAFVTGDQKMPEPELLVGHKGEVNNYESLVWDVEFNPSGDLLASAGGDGKILIWEIKTGRILADQAAHIQGSTSVAFHPRDQILASGGLDGTVKLWGFKN